MSKARFNEEEPSEKSSRRAQPRWNVRLPRFTFDQEVGLGDVIERATSRAGIPPCRSCARRALRLNRLVSFGGRPRP
jgi:hypothetical protein